MVIQRNYTSPIFKLKANIGRKRVKLANSLQDRINNYAKRNDTSYRISEKLSGINDSKLLKESIDKGLEKHSILTLPSYLNNNKNKTEFIKNNKGQPIIFLKPGDKVESHAHEIGHYKNLTSIFNKRGRDKKVRNSFSKSLDTAHMNNDLKNYKKALKNSGKWSENQINALINKQRKLNNNSLKQEGKLDTRKGIGDSIRGMLEGTAIVREEHNASKKAIPILKSIGANEEQIRDGKKRLGYLLQTYKENAKIHVLNPIQNLIQIPSRRRK